MKIKFLPFCVIILVSIFSCQSDTSKTQSNQPTTFANFYVRYMENENRIKATANFDQGKNRETATPIKIENGVFFHNANMNERKIQNYGIRYKYELNGDFSENFKFRFTEPNKGKMNYEVKINPIQKISFPDGISKSKGMSVNWEGLPLAENESLAFLIQGNKGRTIQFVLKGKTETSSIKVPRSEISNLGLGLAKIEVVRMQSLTTEEPNFIVECNTEFYANETDATVVP